MKTNKLAIVSFALALVFGSAAAAVVGHVALNQISKTQAPGKGLALAGVFIGWIEFALLVIVVVNPYAAGYVVGIISGTLS